MVPSTILQQFYQDLMEPPEGSLRTLTNVMNGFLKFANVCMSDQQQGLVSCSESIVVETENDRDQPIRQLPLIICESGIVLIVLQRRVSKACMLSTSKCMSMVDTADIGIGAHRNCSTVQYPAHQNHLCNSVLLSMQVNHIQIISHKHRLPDLTTDEVRCSSACCQTCF